MQDSRERDKPRQGAVASSLTIIQAYAPASGEAVASATCYGFVSALTKALKRDRSGLEARDILTSLRTL